MRDGDFGQSRAVEEAAEIAEWTHAASVPFCNRPDTRQSVRRKLVVGRLVELAIRPDDIDAAGSGLAVLSYAYDHAAGGGVLEDGRLTLLCETCRSVNEVLVDLLQLEFLRSLLGSIYGACQCQYEEGSKKHEGTMDHLRLFVTHRRRRGEGKGRSVISAGGSAYQAPSVSAVVILSARSLARSGPACRSALARSAPVRMVIRPLTSLESTTLPEAVSTASNLATMASW